MTSRDRGPIGGAVNGARPEGDHKLLRTSSGHHAAAYIRQLIFDGELPPGSRVPQEEIAQALGISRTPVREALVALEQEGRVVIEMHRGAFVTAITEQSVRDNQELVEMIFCLIIRRATERAPDELIRRIELAQRKMNDTTDPILFRQDVHHWLDLIMEGGCAGRIAHILVNFRELSPGNFYKVIPGTFDAFKKGTVTVTKAISRRQPDAAVKAYLAMTKISDEHLIAFYHENKLFAEPTGSDSESGGVDEPALAHLIR